MYISTMKYYSFISPLGLITIGHRDGLLFSLSFGTGSSYEEIASPFESDIKECIIGYLTGDTKIIALPYSVDVLEGTVFQIRVWKALCSISYGETKTYGDIAQLIGSPRSFQAVGNACGANPLPLLIPCHRVLAQKGIGGFSAGLPIKEALLRLEGVLIL